MRKPQPSRVDVKREDDEVPRDVADLGATIRDAMGHIPYSERKKLLESFDCVLKSTLRRRRILSLVQEALSQLRLDMKYLVFDLEATRRERDDYRDTLDELDE